jgi:phosphorylcholine metabolism protein LicD
MDDLEKIYNFNDFPTPEEIFTHLSYLSSVLKSNNLKHWIIYGTLLGAIREKNIIKHDYDFDLGILYEDVENILKLNQIISKDNYTLEKGFGVVYNINNYKSSESEYKWRVSLKLKHDDKIIADLYTYKECEDGFMRRYDPQEKIYYWPNSTFPAYFVKELIELEVNGKMFPAPRDPEVLVEFFYGPHWKIPIKAASQDGENHPDYDFYGNYKYSTLRHLIQHVKVKEGVELSPNFEKNKIDFLFPLEHIEYIRENENIHFKKIK